MNKKAPIKISIVLPIGQINDEEQYMTIEITRNEQK